MFRGHKIEFGFKVGRLTATGEFRKGINGREWQCICDCGNETWVRAWQLTALNNPHGIKSCGCLRKEKSKINIKTALTTEARKKAGLSRRRSGAAFREVFYHYKKSAAGRKLSFSLTEEEFQKLTTSSCFYCGTEPKRIFETTNAVEKYIYNGIDRKNNNIGYDISNCVPCCWLCNKMKHTIGIYEFLAHIAKISAWQKL